MQDTENIKAAILSLFTVLDNVGYPKEKRARNTDFIK